MKKQIFRLFKPLAVLLCLILCSCSTQGTAQLSPSAQGSIRVTVLDVGMGDSIFIELTDSRCMLIDAGESDSAETVVDYVSSLGYSKIDYLVGTHPHSDHIGGMREVINSFEIGEIFMPKAESDTYTYEKTLKLIDEKGLEITTAKAGVDIIDESDLSAEIIAPCSDSYSELNNYSAVIKLSFGSRSFLFMGDAETESEAEITADVSADFIKVGHHGSKTSSSSEFVNRVGAQYAAVSVSEDNEYNLPSQSVISRWEESGAEVLMTKDVGNIVAESDGSTLIVGGESSASGESSDTDEGTASNTDSGSAGIGSNSASGAGSEVSGIGGGSDSGDEGYNSSDSNEISGEEAGEAADANGAESGTDSAEASISEYSWILNTNSKRIHRPDCSQAKNIAEKNRAYSSESLDKLISQGYKPCGSCKPEEDEQ